jgi:hypothetical protein
MSVNGFNRILLLCISALAMSACKSSLEDSVGNFRTGVDTGIDPDNSPPTLTGSPEDLVFVGREFSFAPTAADPDGDPLTFTISNKPVWADFDFGLPAPSPDRD